MFNTSHIAVNSTGSRLQHLWVQTQAFILISSLILANDNVLHVLFPYLYNEVVQLLKIKWCGLNSSQYAVFVLEKKRNMSLKSGIILLMLTSPASWGRVCVSDIYAYTPHPQTLFRVPKPINACSHKTLLPILTCIGIYSLTPMSSIFYSFPFFLMPNGTTARLILAVFWCNLRIRYYIRNCYRAEGWSSRHL